MENWKQRTEALIGTEALIKLENTKVIVYGIGGVGSFVCESLVRAGVGNITMVDNDVVSLSNINRQIHANINTIGMLKTEVMKKRILEINPNCNVLIYSNIENEEELIDNTYTYVIDAVDTVKTKISLAKRCKEQKVKQIAAMGAGNKLNPTKLRVSDISKTKVCKLAKVVRKELKRIGIEKLKVVYSEETSQKLKTEENIIGSISYMPSTMGLIIASEVIKDILKI